MTVGSLIILVMLQSEARALQETAEDFQSDALVSVNPRRSLWMGLLRFMI